MEQGQDQLFGGVEAAEKAAASRRTPKGADGGGGELFGQGVQRCWTPTKSARGAAHSKKKRVVK
jgi:hypothetical protein